MDFRYLLRRVFKIRTIFLVGGIYFIWLALSAFVEGHCNFNKLIPRSGVIRAVEKRIPYNSSTESDLYLLDDSTQYICPIALDDLNQNAQIGDSVIIYTKGKVWGLASFKSNYSGDTYSSKPESNVVYHMLAKKNDSTIIDFEIHKEKISILFYHFLFLAGIFIILYLIPRRFFWNISSGD